MLYRVNINVLHEGEDKKQTVKTCIRKTNINASNDYEKCVKRIENQLLVLTENINDTFKYTIKYIFR